MDRNKLVVDALKRVFDVALHPEGVDRNVEARLQRKVRDTVALHPEGVDRNNIVVELVSVFAVALHPEGVDRNYYGQGYGLPAAVALHPEGVDRNTLHERGKLRRITSPSTRRAWIEMYVHYEGFHGRYWSPSTRRAWIEICRCAEL